MLFTPDKLYVKDSNISGKGVFAKSDIIRGEILEECHFIELSESNYDNIDPVLKEYVFTFPIGGKNNCVVFGFGSIYNHSLINNAYWECDLEKKVFRFIANTNIKKDKEILIDYQKWCDF